MRTLTKQERINELQGRIERLENTVEKLRNENDALKVRLDEEMYPAISSVEDFEVEVGRATKKLLESFKKKGAN